MHQFRVGIDVGGTFTKAVAVRVPDGKLAGKATVLTTHDAPEGVARGVVQAFRRLSAETNLSPSQISLVAHSTTQAVNALLEGDVAPVGIVGMGWGPHRANTRKRTQIDDIQLSPGRTLPVRYQFLDTTQGLDEGRIEEALRALIDRGAGAMVATEAFSVENPRHEQQVLEVARRLGLPATAGHEMTGLYGLEVRTLTAAINASILPRMLETAELVEQGIRSTSLQSPLMVMRGDTGIMDINEIRQRPILTVLSGPAASVAGALTYLKILDGIFIEVGGTSTNIGVVQGGRPAMKYVRIMDHPTCLRSVDVRVLGVAGGSLIRLKGPALGLLKGRKIADVGPRSAHIAGLPYPAFSSPEEIRSPELITLAPRPDDPADYVAVRTAGGRTFALTVTDAANILGLVPQGNYAHGNVDACRRAFEPLARRLGVSVEEVARRVLDRAAQRAMGVIRDLQREYHLDHRRVVLVGLGGGAATLVPYIARRLKLEHQIPQHAEVISSIGVALSLISVQMEQSLDRGDPEALRRLIQAAEHATIRAGADATSVRVFTEPIPERRAVRITAVGGGCLDGATLPGQVELEEAQTLAAQVLDTTPDHLTPALQNEHYRVFTVTLESGPRFWRRRRQPIVAIDRSGAVRFQVADGVLIHDRAVNIAARLEETIPQWTRTRGLFTVPPRVAMIHGAHLVDLSALTAEEVVPAAGRELAEFPDGYNMVVIVGRGTNT